MNKEEILAMEAGMELNALAAEKVMGWSIEANMFFKDDDPSRFYFKERKPTVFIEDWNPSTDISAAWEVVEKMKKSNWWIVLSSEGETWSAMFYWDPNQIAIEAISESAPEAICKAALLAVTDS